MATLDFTLISVSSLAFVRKFVSKTFSWLPFQGTFVMTAFYSSHRDASVWDDPLAFKPERFLDENGLLCLSKDKSVPFSAGRRLCAGETFARNSVFLMISALMQSFTVMAPEGKKIPELRESPSGIFCMSPDFWFKFQSR